MGKKDKKDKKKKKKEEKKKKDKKKKEKKKDKKKEAKKKNSSSSDSGSGSSSSSSAEQAKAKKSKKVEGDELLPVSARPVKNLPEPEEGIQRFEYAGDETGPLGLRFSGGFPPMILAVLPDTHAQRKGIPPNFEVHAVNGNALVPANLEVVMAGLKARPVILDVRPQGWKPAEKAKELAKKREKEETEMKFMMEIEERRREQVAQEQAEEAERGAERAAEREEKERLEREKLEKRAREQLAERKAREEEFEKILAQDPADLRKAAADIMAAPYGDSINLAGTCREGKGLPLRLLTRRKEVAWYWAGEAIELIGGGQHDPNDSWLAD